jgi:phospholipid/cholesterol/gamma-HCH transport system substrate-binding protein
MMVTPVRLAGVGCFVMAGLALFAIALFRIGERQLAFDEKFAIFTEFRNITGLQPGAIVRVSGAPAGSVTDIEAPADPNGKFRARLEITEQLHQLVRTDSVATIQTEGLVGGSFLAVSIGTAGVPPAPAGATIQGREPFLLADLFQQTSDTIGKVNAMADQLGAGIERTLASVDTTLGTANGLLADVGEDVRTVAAASSRITLDAAQIAEGLRKGEGTIGKLLKDDDLYARVTAIATAAERIAADTQKTVQQALQALETLKSQGGNVSGVTASVRDTLHEAQTAMAGLSDNMEALKRGFFFRGFFNRRGYFNLQDLSPEEYRKGELAEKNRRASHVWLRDDALFESASPDAVGRLTEVGRAQLDAALAPNLARIVDSVVIVEGYSDRDSPVDRYATSRARAATVREYLIERLQLDPGAVGVMPLGDDARGSPDGGMWNGVALAVFVQK